MRTKRFLLALTLIFLFFYTSLHISRTRSKSQSPYAHIHLNGDIIELNELHTAKSFKSKSEIKTSVRRLRKTRQHYKKYKQEFDAIIQSNCSTQDKHVVANCLGSVYNLDLKIKSERGDAFDRCADCLYQEETKEKVFFYHHTFWQLSDSGSEFHKRVLNLQIVSFLATQNLCCSRLIVWKMGSFGTELEISLRKKFEHYLTSESLIFKEFKLEKICSYDKSGLYSSFRDHKICQEKQKFVPKNLVSYSDFVRFIVLDVYGGIYTGSFFLVR
jgi:hypothetical protein